MLAKLLLVAIYLLTGSFIEVRYVIYNFRYFLQAANPYLTGVPQVGSTYSPYFAPGPIMPTIVGPDPSGVGSPLGVVPQTVVAQQKMPRSDRLEVCYCKLMDSLSINYNFKIFKIRAFFLTIQNKSTYIYAGF